MWREINREKTRLVDLREEGASLDFLERGQLREMTNSHQCHKPIPTLIGELNRQLKGWANSFGFGYPTGVYWEIDWYIRGRLIRHLQRRSQRPYRPPRAAAWYTHRQRLGLVCLACPSESGPVQA